MDFGDCKLLCLREMPLVNFPKRLTKKSKYPFHPSSLDKKQPRFIVSVRSCMHLKVFNKIHYLNPFIL